MAIETELKLHIAPEHLKELKSHALLRRLATGGSVPAQKLYSIYYDTPDLSLRDHAMALRLRKVGKDWLQTLKGGGSVHAGLHRRNEWEAPVAGKALDFEVLAASGGSLPERLQSRLQPVFITSFLRTIKLLHFEGAEIELCMDSGEIIAGDKTHPISELELELKSGSPEQLFKLALELMTIVPLQIEHTSKAEYGYRLFTGEPQAVHKASFPALNNTQSIATALQIMVASCLLHVQGNVPGAIHSQDEEFLHQVRVGMRRLRVVLAMAEDFRADAELHLLHEEVSQLCVEFGRLREWDVFVTQTLAAIHGQIPADRGLGVIERASEKQRKQRHVEVVQTLQSQDYQRLLLRFGAWLNSNYWHTISLSNLPEFAVQVLDKRSRQVAKRGQFIAVADAAQLHALRIACKKLRYSTEMFGSLFDTEQVRRHVKALSQLQDILGALNDIVVAHRQLGELKVRGQQERIARINELLEHERMIQLGKLDTAWEQFSTQKSFWH